LQGSQSYLAMNRIRQVEPVAVTVFTEWVYWKKASIAAHISSAIETVMTIQLLVEETCFYAWGTQNAASFGKPPRPLSYMTPRLLMALALPASAALRNQRSQNGFVSARRMRSL
jgi:hypothetical protein